MPQETKLTDPTNDAIDQAEEINLLDSWRVVKKRRKVILGLVLGSVIVAAVINFMITPTYQSRTTLLPVESSPAGFSVSALAALQNIPFIGGAVGGALGKTATDKLVTILSSRTVAEDVIKKMDLTRIIFSQEWDREKGKWKSAKPPSMQDTLRVLQKEMVKIADDRKGLISISVESADPKMAADIANEYSSSLQRFLIENAISLAKRNRLFLEKQLATTKGDLQSAEEELRNYQTQKKIVALDAQAEGAVKALADLKAQIISREVQLGAMREFATKENYGVKRLEDELRELRLQLKGLETGLKKPGVNESTGAVITLSEGPSVGLGYARLKRDALIQQKLFELLTQQYELAKIEEAKDDLAFQIIDPAIPPEKPIKPRKALNVGIAGAASLFFGVLLVFILEGLERRRFKEIGTTS